MKYLASLLVTAWLISSHTNLDAQDPAAGWTMTATDSIKVEFAGKPVTTYNLGVKEGKPFFYPLYGPTGGNMTRHWPQTELREGEQSDHIHHRGMWYGLGNVNGLDFWHFPGTKRGKKFGRIVHRSARQEEASEKGLKFSTESDWVNNETDEFVCKDTRTFEFSHDENGSLVVDTTITLVASKGDVLIKDDKEGAWSIRVPATMRLEGKVARGGILNSAGNKGKDAWGKRAHWVHYHGPDEKGNEAGITIMDHPANLRHPTWWHARHYGLFTANPFGQGNFEKKTKVGAGNYTIKNGESLTFRYRTVFHKGGTNPGDLKAAYGAFSG